MAKKSLVVLSFVLLALSRQAVGAESGSEVPLVLTPTDPQLKWDPCPSLFPKGCEIAVLHGDPARPNADVFLKVPANYTMPPHWHTSAERMVLVSGKLQVEYRGRGPTCSRQEPTRTDLPSLYTRLRAAIPRHAFSSLHLNPRLMLMPPTATRPRHLPDVEAAKPLPAHLG